ncbi:MAG: hypothetical protein ACUVRO_04175, partial [Armatimonadota bacterium]
MAKFLIVSALAETVGLAIRLMAEGHEVLYYIHSKGSRDCGDGLLQKVDDWRKHIEEADVIFFDDVHQKQEGESVYDGGRWFLEVREKHPAKLVIGGPPEAARLENDRMYAQEVLRKYGIPAVEMRRFTGFAEARKYVEGTKKGYAVKHNGQVDRDLAGAFFTPEETVEFLEWLEEVWPELGRGQPVDFVLQEAVEGVEFAVTCFFDGEKWRDEACYLNQEEKKELVGGLGRSTGQTGEIGYITPSPRLFQETLLKLEPLMREQGVCGFFDLNCIIAGDRVVPLEFTGPRPGYPTLYSFCELLAEPVGQFFLRMASHDPVPISYCPGVCCTVVLASGTFPDQHPTRNKLAAIHGLEKTGLRHVWLGEVRLAEGKVRGAG